MNNDRSIILPPSQKEFCSKNIKNFDEKSWNISVAGKAGSDRSFYRISPPEKSSVPGSILIVWDSSDNDWERFMGINQEFSSELEIFPEIYAVDETCGLILEEDCGTTNLKQFCSSGMKREEISKIYRNVLSLLIKWQAVKTVDMPHITGRVMNLEMYLWETDYFANHCVKEYFGLGEFLGKDWEEERNVLAKMNTTFPLVPLHRDFQSENIMISPGKIRFVDYQGARLGSAEYDVASLLCDPYMIVITDGLRDDLLDFYMRESGSIISKDTFNLAAIQRLMQALGAYTNLFLHRGKRQYEAFIYPALHILNNVLEEVEGYYRIKDIVKKCFKKQQHK